MLSYLSLGLTAEQVNRLADDRRRELAGQWGWRSSRVSDGAVAARGVRLVLPRYRRRPAEC